MKLINYRIYAVIFSVIMLASCGDKNNEGDEPDFPPILPHNYYVSPACVDCQVTVGTRCVTGIDRVLGAGYDITGPYLSSESLRESVIDLEKMDGDLKTVLRYPSGGTPSLWNGDTSYSFLSDIMGYFGVNVSQSSPTYAFAGTLTSRVAGDSYILRVSWSTNLLGRINTLSHNLMNGLSDSFINDVKTLDPEDLIDRYGTHIIICARMGIIVRQIYRAYIPESIDDRSATLYDGLGAVLSKINRENVKWNQLSDELCRLRNFGATLSMDFYGGDPELIEYDADRGVLGDMTSWSESLNDDNCALASLKKEDIIPLTAVIEDTDRHQAVADAISRRVRNSSSFIVNASPVYQFTDGTDYRYVTSLSQVASDKMSCYGIIGSVYNNPVEGSVPLYSYNTSESQRFTTDSSIDNWWRIGYIMEAPGENTVTVQELTDGRRYIYTIEQGDTFGPRAEWHSTGRQFYFIRP